MSADNKSIPVLYISYDGMTDPLGQSQVIPYLQGLTIQGYRFTIISFEKAARFNELKDHIQKLLRESEITWVPLTYHKSPPVVSTLYDIYVLRRKAFELYQKHNFQIVHCRSYIQALVGLALKQKTTVKFIFDMRGFWADERVEGGLWPLNNPVYRLVYRYFKRKEKQLLQAANYTITLTHKAQEIIHQWQVIDTPSIPIQVIPCCVDVDLFDPEKIDKASLKVLRKELGIPADAFVLSYLGSLGTWYMVEEMLHFYKMLLNIQPNIFFLFITQDSPQQVEEICKKNNIGLEKIVINSVLRQEVPLYLSLSNWSIFFIKPMFSKQASSATKMGEIMSMDIPFITNRGWGDVELIIEEGCPTILVNVGSEEELKKGVNNLFTCRRPPRVLRQIAFERYDLQVGIQNYDKVYQDVFSAARKI